LRPRFSFAGKQEVSLSAVLDDVRHASPDLLALSGVSIQRNARNVMNAINANHVRNTNSNQ